jgi:ferrochelatase
MARRVAVVLFNLGGPDSQRAVRPFLFNLFADPAIIRLPAPARLALATLISTTRAKSARANYQMMGGASPLLPETQAQARALESALAGPDLEARAFIAMRYWAPLSADTARQVAAFAPDDIVLLPLYPQFSTTTTASSLKAWRAAYRGAGRVHTVCCYPTQPQLIAAHVARIRQSLAAAPAGVPLRLLFSAHGLPQQVVDDGDPYEIQINATAQAIAAQLPELPDWQVCYQSRVGRLKWLGPYTPQALEAAAGEGKGVIVVPIAFVSDHVETLVELDHDYARLAADLGCPAYIRVAALGIEPSFIAGLAAIVTEALPTEATAPAQGWTCERCGPICLARQQARGGTAA